jgi:hypothetical protein
MGNFIDPDLKYCPRCRDEYRADIMQCADCGIELISGARLLEINEEKERASATRGREITAEDQLVEMRKGSVIEMKQVQAMLAREGVPSLLAGCEKGCGKGCRGTEVILQVRLSDAREVAALFVREHEQTTGLKELDTTFQHAVFNTAAEQVTCPACGFTFSTNATTCPDCGLCFA